MQIKHKPITRLLLVACPANPARNSSVAAHLTDVFNRRQPPLISRLWMELPQLHPDSRLFRRRPSRVIRLTLGLLLLAIAGATASHASVALLLEESYGEFGALSPTGHAAIYLNHVCAATPTSLRPCQAGEFGAVISRYHKIDGYDWIAVPLIPYLYSVDQPSEMPPSVDKPQVAALRDAYRRQHLEDLAPDTNKGKAPGGEWTQLVGSSYDRTIHGFQVKSTPEQDQRFMAIFNDRRDVSHFNLLFHNCADFSRVVLDIYLPNAIHRNFIADIGLTTPKQVAKSLVAYSQRHPEVEMSAFIIPQVPGTIKRSHPADGITESLVKTKKYLIPLAVLSPELTGGVIAAYLAEGRSKLPKTATVFNIDDAEIDTPPSPAASSPKPSTPDPSPAATSPAATSASPAAAPMLP
jgi:hypothetical protein